MFKSFNTWCKDCVVLYLSMVGNKSIPGLQSYSATNSTSLKYHKERDHEGVVFRCTVCFTIIKSKGNIYHHMNTKIRITLIQTWQ